MAGGRGTPPQLQLAAGSGERVRSRGVGTSRAALGLPSLRRLVSNRCGARELLIQACGSCHDDVLDQRSSHARFKLAPRALRARRRHRTPASAAWIGCGMPSKEARRLDAAGLARLIDALTLEARGPAVVDALERAAQRGMAQSPLPVRLRCSTIRRAEA